MEEIVGSIYCNNSELFGTRLMKNMFKTIKAEKHDLGVVMKEKENWKFIWILWWELCRERI